jgi:hypothetical protein
MSFGKSSSSSAPVVTPEQKAAIAAQTKFLTGTIIPNYQGAVGGARDVYNRSAPNIERAMQNQAAIAGQVQQTTGEVGESALRTGVTGLESLFDPNYEANQIRAALAPAQGQYEQNVNNQRMNFGGTGNLGSARQALADRQLAGQNASMMANTAAQVQQGIAAQRAGVGSQLAQIGSQGLGQSLGAAGNMSSAYMMPQQLYNQYASVIYGTPSSSYTPDFRGTQGVNTSGTNIGFNFLDAKNAFGGKLPGMG